VLVEDSSLCFNAINGMPGPYIKWFLEDCGLDKLVDMIGFSKDKTGYAQTVLAYYCPGTGSGGGGEEEETDNVRVFDGRTQGNIVRQRHDNDRESFGWDPIFEPLEQSSDKKLTYAEMPTDEKNRISHRKRALDLMREYLMDAEKK